MTVHFDCNGDRLTACEAMHWIAFGQTKSWEEYDGESYDLNSRWEFALGGGAAVGAELREALAARILESPFCPVSFWDDLSIDGGYRHRALSPQGPRLLQRLRAKARKRDGRLVSYREILAELENDIALIEAQTRALDIAGIELVKALRAKKLTAVGQRGFEPPPGSDYVEVPPAVFEHPATKLYVYDRFGADVGRPLIEWKGYRSDFANMRFSREEIQMLWPQTKKGPKSEARRRDPAPGTVDRFGPQTASDQVKPVIPANHIKEYFCDSRDRGETPLAADASVARVAALYPNYLVPRQKVREAHRAVYGRLRPGKRPRSA